MRKYIFTIFITLSFSACGSSSSSNDSNSNNFNVTPGIYTGTFTTSKGVTGELGILITSNGKWAGTDPDSAATGTVSGDTLTGDDFNAKLTNATGGTYTSEDISGTFNLSANTALYNRSSSLSKLNGTWVDNVFTDVTGTVTFTMNNGAITMTSVLGCAAMGSVNTIDTTKDEYALSFTVTNCPGFNGVYSGYGYTEDDTFTDDVLTMVLDSEENFAIFSPVKQ